MQSVDRGPVDIAAMLTDDGNDTGVLGARLSIDNANSVSAQPLGFGQGFQVVGDGWWLAEKMTGTFDLAVILVGALHVKAADPASDDDGVAK